MVRCFLRWLAPLLMAAVCWLTPAAVLAQPPDSNQPTEREYTPVLPYFVAAVATLILLIILCMPSRKK
jgi:hypothetical protein